MVLATQVYRGARRDTEEVNNLICTAKSNVYIKSRKLILSGTFGAGLEIQSDCYSLRRAGSTAAGAADYSFRTSPSVRLTALARKPALSGLKPYTNLIRIRRGDVFLAASPATGNRE
ncbi:hypothetical protein LNQ03_10935 [Klebsiella pneumoniae subsp. pneumoniae]|nr:hypothetical protein [Klebsiella pneumoniae subsp. pneumoniae]